jgi:hypothetical protein
LLSGEKDAPGHVIVADVIFVAGVVALILLSLALLGSATGRRPAGSSGCRSAPRRR